MCTHGIIKCAVPLRISPSLCPSPLSMPPLILYLDTTGASVNRSPTCALPNCFHLHQLPFIRSPARSKYLTFLPPACQRIHLLYVLRSDIFGTSLLLRHVSFSFIPVLPESTRFCLSFTLFQRSLAIYGDSFLSTTATTLSQLSMYMCSPSPLYPVVISSISLLYRCKMMWRADISAGRRKILHPDLLTRYF